MSEAQAATTPEAQAIEPGSPQWEALMAQVGDKLVPGSATQQQTEEQQPERPGWLPEKFKSPEDLAKAYSELEKKLSQPKPSQTPEQQAQGEQSPQGNAQEQQAREASAQAGVDYDALSAEYAAKGELSAESYTALEKAGIPRALVDQYIEGQSAVAEARVNRVTAVAGGEEAYTQMIAWAKTNFTAEEAAAYDRAIYSDPATAELAARGLVAKYQAANGRFGNLIDGKGGARESVGYGSRQEMSRDMNDPRYKSGDKAFHAEVERKLAATTAF